MKTKTTFTKVSELYKDIHGYPLKGQLRIMVKSMSEKDLTKFYNELVENLQSRVNEMEKIANDNHELFFTRILGMMKDYDISLRTALEWDAEGLELNIFNARDQVLYLNANKLSKDMHSYYIGIMSGTESDMVVTRRNV